MTERRRAADRALLAVTLALGTGDEELAEDDDEELSEDALISMFKDTFDAKEVEETR